MQKRYVAFQKGSEENMSEIFIIGSGAGAIYEEYANSYKAYCELPKAELRKVRKYFDKIDESLKNLDKTYAKRGEP